MNGNGASQYVNLQAVVRPDIAGLSPAKLRSVMDRTFGAGAAEQYDDYLEDIFSDFGHAVSSAARDVGRAATAAAPAVAKVGGGVLQGAMAGSAAGLPGMIAGGIVGGVGTGLSQYGHGTARDIGKALTGITNVAGQFTPVGRAGSALGSAVSGLAGSGSAGAAGAAVNALSGLLGQAGGGQAAGALASLFGGSSAASQLLSLLQRPETMKALAALNLGQLGRRTIPVGSSQTPVPVSAITNLIGQLAHEATAEAAALADGTESTLEYMIDETGEFAGDPASDRDRAARTWNLLNEAQAERVLGQVAAARPPMRRRFPQAEAIDESEDALYEALDLADIYALQDAEDFPESFDEFAGEWDEGAPA